MSQQPSKLEIEKQSSNGFLPKLPLHDVRKNGFSVGNAVETRSADAQRTLEVREQSSNRFLPKLPNKTVFPFGVYVHWPYCLTKCPYCDFFSGVSKGDNQEKLVDEYLEDLDFYYQMTSNRVVSSIFFGGGTPSLLKPELISKIINHIAKLWPLSKNVEVSLEANPNTDNGNLFADLKSAGINRLSLGVQALNDMDLRFLGRSHNYKQALSSIDNVLHNFDNHSMDLIYARPHQKLSDWEQELQTAISFGFKHLSLYQLTIEEGTFFAKKGVQAMEDDAAAIMYDFTTEFLGKHHYPRYEVSNFAQPEYESRHNLLYWQGNDYLGIGPSAHGRIQNDGKIYATTHRQQLEELNAYERAEELLLMGLRLDKGIDKLAFQHQSGLSFAEFINQQHLETLQSLGFLEDSEQNLRLTKKGFLVMNKIIEELI